MRYLFDKYWFENNQKKLLFLLNTSIIMYWSRWIFRIYGKRSSIGNNKIVKIEPNSISWGTKKINKTKIQVTTEFRTHNKYSERIFNAFYYIWYMFHIWDVYIANKLYP